LDSLGRGVAVIRSATKRSIEGDYPQDSDYREDNNFFYLTGLEEPGGRLVLVARDSAADRQILYLPARDTALQHWSSPRLGPGEEARALTGIADIRPAERADSEIARLPGAEVPEARLRAR
jgi:Xaa-Pro aminopeptidase